MSNKIKGLGIVDVDIDLIKPNPYQPPTRIEVPDDEAAALGASFELCGMTQIPVGRFVAGEGNTDSERITNGHYEMADGWRRLSGYRWNRDHGVEGYEKIKFDQRVLTDQQMANIIIESNQKRKDLNIIEQAELYRRYLVDFKMTQAQLAEEHGISQGELANTIRLLELPVSIQTDIASGHLTPAHGRTLLQLRHEADFALDAVSLAENAVERNWTVSALDNAVKVLFNKRRPKMDFPQPQGVDGEPPETARVEIVPSREPEELPAVADKLELAAESAQSSTAKAEEPKRETPSAHSVSKENKPEPATKPAVPPAWKRKMIIEETDNGCTVSVMAAGKFPFLRKIENHNLDSILSMKIAGAVLEDADSAWQPKEEKDNG